MNEYNGENVRGLPVRGPLPKGSRALIRLTLEKSLYPFEGDPYLGKSQKGLAQLPVKLEIASGRYAGYYWYQRITVPVEFQRIELEESQKISCQVGGQILRAILESAHGINQGDRSQGAEDLRKLVPWQKFNGLMFPAKLDIDHLCRFRNGRAIWNNSLKYILPVDDTDYQFIMDGGEYISKGPVCCETLEPNFQTPEEACKATTQP